MCVKNNNHYLFVIYDKYTKKFLTYYDEKWDCYFLINAKKEGKSLKNMVDDFLNALNIDNERLKNIVYLKVLEFSRYCIPEKREKNYVHSYWQILIDDFLEQETGIVFGRNGIRYKWLTLDEMLNNKKIYSKNKEVIEHLKEIVNGYRFIKE